MWAGNFLQPLFAKPVVFYAFTRRANEKSDYYVRAITHLDSGYLVPQVSLGRYSLEDRDAMEMSTNILRHELKAGKKWSLDDYKLSIHATAAAAHEHTKKGKHGKQTIKLGSQFLYKHNRDLSVGAFLSADMHLN